MSKQHIFLLSLISFLTITTSQAQPVPIELQCKVLLITDSITPTEKTHLIRFKKALQENDPWSTYDYLYEKEYKTLLPKNLNNLLHNTENIEQKKTILETAILFSNCSLLQAQDIVSKTFDLKSTFKEIVQTYQNDKTIQQSLKALKTSHAPQKIIEKLPDSIKFLFENLRTFHLAQQYGNFVLLGTALASVIDFNSPTCKTLSDKIHSIIHQKKNKHILQNKEQWALESYQKTAQALLTNMDSSFNLKKTVKNICKEYRNNKKIINILSQLNGRIYITNNNNDYRTYQELLHQLPAEMIEIFDENYFWHKVIAAGKENLYLKYFKENPTKKNNTIKKVISFHDFKHISILNNAATETIKALFDEICKTQNN